MNSDQRGVGLVLLAGIDGVASVGICVVGGVGRTDGNKPRNKGKAVIADAEERDPMPAGLDDAQRVDLVLLAMLQPLEKSIPVRGFECHPESRACAEASGEIDVAIVACKGEEGIDRVAQRSEEHTSELQSLR